MKEPSGSRQAYVPPACAQRPKAEEMKEQHLTTLTVRGDLVCSTPEGGGDEGTDQVPSAEESQQGAQRPKAEEMKELRAIARLESSAVRRCSTPEGGGDEGTADFDAVLQQYQVLNARRRRR